MLAFEDLIAALGEQIGQSLAPDENRNCALRVNEQFLVQIQHDIVHEQIMIVTFLHEVPAGKVREEALKEALKSNHQFPRVGTLSFLAKNSTMVLHDFLPLKGLSANRLAGYLVEFLDKATAWKNALESGKSAPASTTPGAKGSIFDVPKKDEK